MNNDYHLRLQALVDGELPGNESAAMAEEISRDPQAQALLAEIKATNAALAGFEAEVKVPETRDFYWSQVRRRIEASERMTQPRRASPDRLAAWRRLLVPLGATAVVLVLGLFVTIQTGLFQQAPVAAAELDSALMDPGALTYRDFSARTTLVWLTYPAEN